MGSRLAALSLCRSGLLIKSEGQTRGLPPSFSSSLPPSLPSSTATGYSVAPWDVGRRRRRRRSRRGEQGADAESLAACGVCKLWLCGQTGDSNRQIRCFWATALSLSFTPYPQTPRGSYSLSACVWLGVAAAVLGLSTFLCVCAYASFCVWFIKAWFLGVYSHVDLQPDVFLQDHFFQTNCNWRGLLKHYQLVITWLA